MMPTKKLQSWTFFANQAEATRQNSAFWATEFQTFADPLDRQTEDHKCDSKPAVASSEIGT